MKTAILILIAALAALSCNPTNSAPDTGVVEAAQPRTPTRINPLQSHPVRTPSPPDTRTPAQIAQAACTAPNGTWQCKNVAQPKTFKAVSGAIIPPAWTVSAWFFDPQNVSGTASDGNNCTTSSTACISFQQIYTYRWGGNGAQLQQHTVVTELSSQSAATDKISITLDLLSNSIEFDGTLTSVATPTIGTFTVRNRTAGTTNTITATGQSGAYWTPFVGDLVHDTTANAYFWINADLGSATAQITEPLAQSTYTGILSAPPAYVTIANGDSLSVVTNSNLNLVTSLRSTIYAVDVKFQTAYTGYTDSAIHLYQSSTNTTASTAVNIAVDYTGNVVFYNSLATPVATGHSGLFVGGSIVQNNPVVQSTYCGTGFGNNGCRLDGDVLITPTTLDAFRMIGGGFVGRAGLLGIIQSNGESGEFSGNIEQVPSIYGVDSELWGPGQLQLTNGMTYSFDAASGITTAAASLLLTGASFSGVPLTCEYATQTTAFPWVAGSHTYGAAVALTAANIDSNNGLTCLPSGSKFWFRP